MSKEVQLNSDPDLYFMLHKAFLFCLYYNLGDQ